MQARRKSKIDDDRLDYLTDEMFAKTCLQFFLDGFDTAGCNFAIALYGLAANERAQIVARKEVLQLAKKLGHDDNEDEVGLDDLKELKYLDQVIDEAARMAALPATFRICTKPWSVPGTSAVIPVGMKVYIPMLPFHMDPDYFEDPNSFEPDRFRPGNKDRIVTGTYFPFGLGPRQCLGMKIARIEFKMLLFHVLKNFDLYLGPKTPFPIKLSAEEFNRIDGGCRLIFRRR